MEALDHYHTLGISRGADADEIKRAYRSLIQTLHPDRGMDGFDQAERFRAVQAAYEVLSDPARRSDYDGRWITVNPTWVGELSTQCKDVSHDAAGALAAEKTPVSLTFEQALQGGTVSVDVRDVGVVSVPVPKGVRSGMEVRFAGKRGDPRDAHSSDLHVAFHVSPSLRFRREGNDLHIREPITVIEALLGTQRSITNAYGQNVKVVIPQGTQPGERLRLRGQGVRTATQQGDLYVEVTVVVPRTLTTEQRETLAACVRDLGLQ